MRGLLLLVLGVLPLAVSAEDAASRLSAARSLKCHFTGGVSTDWTSGIAKTNTSAQFDEDVTFDAIDLKRGTVRVIGNIGSGDARVTLTPVGLSIFDLNPGVVDVTTVFSVYDKSGSFIAVDTRHVNAFALAMAEQYYGTCKVWQ